MEELFETCVAFLEKKMDADLYFFNVFKQRPESRVVGVDSLRYFLESFGVQLDDAKRSILPNMEESMKRRQILDLETFSKMTSYYRIDLQDFKDNVNNAYTFTDKCDPIYLIKAYWGTIHSNLVEK